MYFHYFVIISSWKRAWPFICTKLIPLHQRMSSGEEEENVKSLRQPQCWRTNCDQKSSHEPSAQVSLLKWILNIVWYWAQWSIIKNPFLWLKDMHLRSLIWQCKHMIDIYKKNPGNWPYKYIKIKKKIKVKIKRLSNITKQIALNDKKNKKTQQD